MSLFEVVAKFNGPNPQKVPNYFRSPSLCIAFRKFGEIFYYEDDDITNYRFTDDEDVIAFFKNNIRMLESLKTDEPLARTTERFDILSKDEQFILVNAIIGLTEEGISYIKDVSAEEDFDFTKFVSEEDNDF